MVEVRRGEEAAFMMADRAETGRRLYGEALVWDDHSGFMPWAEADLGQLRRWIDCGVSYLSVNVGFDAFDWQQTVRNLATFRAWFERHADDFTLIETAGDILAAKAAGKLAIGFDIEGMRPLDGDLAMIPLYYRLGVRQMLFAYNLNNEAGGGCHDRDEGLTAFGRAAIAEMNRVGMLVDCSHCSLRTSLEAIEASSAPVIFSHSNPRAVHAHGRNITDEQIKACARTGGVVGINGIGLFLGDRSATAQTMARHIAYAAELVGAQHVGIGLDYDWDRSWGTADAPFTVDMRFWPAGTGYDDLDGFEHAPPERLRELPEVLLSHGLSADEIKGVLGGNFLRVAQQVWH
jgi:membrane dipeptidase